MLKHLLTLIIFCFILLNLTAHENWDSNDDFDIDLGIKFDDFPDNSIPELDSDFNDSEDFEFKEPHQFISKPDTAETIEQQSELGVDFHAFPSAIVNGCVNIISGEYQETATDLSIPGIKPLNMQRYYNGNKCKRHSFLYGCSLTHGAKLFCYKSNNHDNAILKGSERHGTLYKTSLKDHLFHCPDSFFEKGITNCSSGEISAKTNIKNDFLNKHNSEMYELCTVDQAYLFSKSPGDFEQKNRHTMVSN